MKWKVDIDDESKVKDVSTVEDIKQKKIELKAKHMKPANKLRDDYFSDKPLAKHVHIIITVPISTGKCYPSNKKFAVTKYRFCLISLMQVPLSKDITRSMVSTVKLLK